MTKELIERINKELTDFAHNRELGHLLCESVIAIERLELEAIAATLRIENDKLVISTLQRKFAVLSDFGAMETMYNAGIEQEHEIVTMRERIKSLKRCIGDFDGTTRENIELRAELSALKNQPHIARATGKNSGDYSEVARVYETPLPAGVALYLAPGAQPEVIKEVIVHADYRAMWRQVTKSNQELCAALSKAQCAQPVPEGYQLVPIEPTEAMIRSYLVAQSTAAMQTDRAFGMSDPMENFKAGYKSMLEAAKGESK